MALFGGKKNYFSLAVLPYKLQVLQLNSRGDKVIKADEVSLSKEIINDGRVVDPKKLAEIVKKLITKNKIKTKNVVIAIPEEKVFTKIVELPKMKRSEIDESVRWQAKEFLPYSLDQSYLDWRIVDQHKKDRLAVLVVSVPKETIDSYIEVVDKLDLKPVCLETITVSLSRLVDDEEKLTIVTEIQPKDATIALCSGKKIMASSVISLTGEENGIGEDYFLKTLTKMVNFYENKFDQEISNIFICGQAVSKNLKKKIAKELKKSSDFCPLKIKNWDFKKANNYSVAISLSRRKITAPEDEQTINLLPPQIQKEYNQQRRLKALQWSFWWLTFFLALVAGGLISIYFYNQNRLAGLEEKMAGQSGQLSLTQKQSQRIKTINEKTEQVENLIETRDFPQRELVEIIKSAPEKVTLTNLEYDMNSQIIRLGGQADQRQDLLDFKKNLQNNELFHSVLIPISSLEKETNLDFSLSLQLTENGRKN